MAIDGIDPILRELIAAISGGAEGAATEETLAEVQAALVAGTLKIQLVDSGGVVADISAANALKVDGSDVTQPVSGPATNAELRATPLPVQMTDGTDVALVDASGNLHVELHVDGNTMSAVPSNADGIVTSGSTTLLSTRALLIAFNGTTFDRVRTPNVLKTAKATASGDTAVWTPASGKKFRVMRYSIQITADAATAAGGVLDIVLRDATTAIGAGLSVFVPAVAGTTFGTTNSTGWCEIGNGILSSTADNVLNVNLSAALTSGTVRVVVSGTEE